MDATVRMMFLFVALEIALFGYCAEGRSQTEHGVICNGPRDEVVAPGETAYFNCHARGRSVYLHIDHQDPHRTSHSQSGYEARGFTFSYADNILPTNACNTTTGSSLPEHNHTITVEARLSNNNTRISCTATGRRTGDHDYQEGFLIIAGPPLSPSIHHYVEHVANDTFTFHLSWRTFMWARFPITSYKFSLLNDSSGQFIVSENTLSLPEYNFTTEGRYCSTFTFTLSANNSLGEGEQSVVRLGQPILAGEIGDIETVVTFHSNGTPHFWMSFLTPQICPGYQTLTYNITVYSSEDNGVVYNFGSKNLIQDNNSERTLIVKELRTGLDSGENYEVTVETESIGSFRSKSKSFDTFFTGCQCTTESDHDTTSSQYTTTEGTTSSQYTTTEGTTSFKNTTTEGTTSSQNTTMSEMDKVTQHTTTESFNESNAQKCDQKVPYDIIVIAIGTASALVIIILIVTVFILLRLLSRQRKKPINEPDGQQLLRLQSRRIESSNPIYEGAAIAVYEATPGEFAKPLLTPKSSLNTSSDSTPRYVDKPPDLPPPRGEKLALNSSTYSECRVHVNSKETNDIKISPKPSEICCTDGDEYMVMGPTKEDSPKVSGQTLMEDGETPDGDEKYATLGSH